MHDCAAPMHEMRARRWKSPSTALRFFTRGAGMDPDRFFHESEKIGRTRPLPFATPGTPDESPAAICFLARADASYITATICSGGRRKSSAGKQITGLKLTSFSNYK